MSLGEAFIEVRADMRPFIRDLDRQVLNAVRRVEQGIQGAFNLPAGQAGSAGQRAGQEAGDGFTRGMKNSLFSSNQNVFVTLASALASSLDDGISALPTEIKAALVGGVLLATPVIGAALGAAIATGLGIGVAGLGVLLAFQFEDVRERATEFGRDIRDRLSMAAEAFGPAVIEALNQAESKIISLDPVIKRVFDSAATFIQPLASALLEALETFVDAFDSAIPRLKPFIDTFAIGIQETLGLVAEGLRRLSNTGEQGQQALRDLFAIINLLIMSFFGVIFVLTKVNALFHQLLRISTELSPIMAVIVKLIGDNVPAANGALITSNFAAADSFKALVSATKKEEKEARALGKALETLVDAKYDNIDVDIEFERSLDRISDSLRENGKTLDIQKEKGRQNVESFTRGLKAAEERALNRLQVQGYTAEQAAALYDQEIDQLRKVARQAGITDAQFNTLFGDIIAVTQIRMSSEEIGVDDLSAGLDEATRNALDLLNLIRGIQRATITGAIGGVTAGRRYADGDIVNRPTLGIFGEAGPEVIIPLTRPARAAELAQKSGLTAMLGANGTVVMVYIGNEQLDARMVRVVERNNQAQARALSHGGRTV